MISFLCFCDNLYQELKDLSNEDFDHFRMTAVNTLSNLLSDDHMDTAIVRQKDSFTDSFDSHLFSSQ